MKVHQETLHLSRGQLIGTSVVVLGELADRMQVGFVGNPSYG